MIVGLVSVSPHVPRLVDSVGFLVVPLTPTTLLSLFCRVPKLFLMFSCGSLHLFPSVARCSLSDDDYKALVYDKLQFLIY